MAVTEDLVRKIAHEEAVKALGQVGWDIQDTDGAVKCVADTQFLRKQRLTADGLPERVAKRRATVLGWVMALVLTLTGGLAGKLLERYFLAR